MHWPRGGFTVRKSWGTMRYTRPSYYVCTHYEEVSPWENLVGPRVFLMIKRLFSRSIGVNYVNHTMWASTTRRSHREKILWDHEIFSWSKLFSRSILVDYVNQTMCVSTMRRLGFTVRKSWGTTRYPQDLWNIFQPVYASTIVTALL